MRPSEIAIRSVSVVALLVALAVAWHGSTAAIADAGRLDEIPEARFVAPTTRQTATKPSESEPPITGATTPSPLCEAPVDGALAPLAPPTPSRAVYIRLGALRI